MHKNILNNLTSDKNIKYSLFFVAFFAFTNFAFAQEGKEISTFNSFKNTINSTINSTVNSTLETFSSMKKEDKTSEGGDDKENKEVKEDDKQAGKNQKNEIEKTGIENVENAIDKNVCEIYDDTLLNSFTLDIVSNEAKIKIEKIEETIDDETFLRDTIFGSVKNLLGLQKTEKIIFREMKKEIVDAKNFYNSVDDKVIEVDTFLGNVVCENLENKEGKKNKENLLKLNEESADLIFEEETFRKQFAGSLKDKMSILQKGVKDAKK